MKTLIVIDMQNDFITGPLGSKEAQMIVPKVKQKIEEYRERGDAIVFTRDTHYSWYSKTLEGKKLPVPHCIKDTDGWQIVEEIIPTNTTLRIIDKDSFGYDNWKRASIIGDIEIIGVCTDICVISNALSLKAAYPETEITIDASCCAGTSPESHQRALAAMEVCQINIINN